MVMDIENVVPEKKIVIVTFTRCNRQVVLTENKTTGIGIATSELSESTEKPFALLSSLHRGISHY
jgi:hypothetical protein